MRKGNDVLAVVYALEVLAHVMLISMDIVVNMQSVLITAANMALVIWKPTAASVMKDGQVILVLSIPFSSILNAKNTRKISK